MVKVQMIDNELIVYNTPNHSLETSVSYMEYDSKVYHKDSWVQIFKNIDYKFSIHLNPEKLGMSNSSGMDVYVYGSADKGPHIITITRLKFIDGSALRPRWITKYDIEDMIVSKGNFFRLKATLKAWKMLYGTTSI